MSKQIPALIKDVYDDLGYAEVMHAIGENGEKAGYKYTHCTNAEPMPMAKFQSMVGYVGKRKRPAAIKAVFGIGTLLMAPVQGVIVDRALINAMGEGTPLSGLVLPPEVTEMCSHCSDPVRYLPVCGCRWSRR